ncbi:polysaccharide deacetylase family protein [Bacillus mesophilus]|uniref:Polysaccharide deacetylase family protein n=2 Tax=Bacillus mesophilus TaxID=1808955 RepID=A0A6M0Q2J6_9BACI|nr:polysaccharide deacetylase family protein [Bacillus mesophilus]NEY70402.1 polysaccharide deacetylase family protein [Bacillus mesophilus]
MTACANETDQATEQKESIPPQVEVEKENEITVIDKESEHEPNHEDESTEGKDDSIIDAESETINQTFDEPQYKVNESNWNVQPIDGANDKVVLFTFDDAPDQYGLEIAKLLKEKGVGAIFFVNGHFIDTPEEKAILKQIYDLGFPIGNHTWNHKNLKKLTEQEQYEEIVLLSEEIEKITGEKPKFFRAPFGANTDYAREVVRQEGMVLMNWTYGYDFMKEYMNKEALADIMVNTNLLTNGANLLMHDREWTYQALPEIIEGLHEKGYEIIDPNLIATASRNK